MVYDGRLPNIPWREQDISTMGYHYYMTPETAQLGLSKLSNAISMQPRKWELLDWPDLTKMTVFNSIEKGEKKTGSASAPKSKKKKKESSTSSDLTDENPAKKIN